jgi:NhaP-type Na+/H+ and K+/H+ antiporter
MGPPIIIQNICQYVQKINANFCVGLHMQYVHIMERAMILAIWVNEQSMVVQDHNILHTTDFLMPIKV